jgi:hypothetical protein
MPDFSRHVQLRVIRQIFMVHGEMVTFIFFFQFLLASTSSCLSLHSEKG